MILNSFGEILAQVMSTNPALGSIPTASAILDVSNYTFQAITLGKDADGFKYHAHIINSSSVSSYNDGFVRFVRYNSLQPSSYHVSATYVNFSSTYSSLPCYPSVYDSRLERNSTESNYSASPNYGHYGNPVIDSSLSSAWNVIGGYPPSGNTAKYAMYNVTGGLVISGNLSGVFNTYGVVDSSGFIRISAMNGSAAATAPWTSGAKVVAYSTISSTPIVDVYVCVQMGDAAALEAFGGIKHIGLYCFDVPAMLRAGLRPPFTWSAVNNPSIYKLVGKVTFLDDLLVHDDALGFSGYQYSLVSGTTTNAANKGPNYNLKLNF